MENDLTTVQHDIARSADEEERAVEALERDRTRLEESIAELKRQEHPDFGSDLLSGGGDAGPSGAPGKDDG